MAAYKAAPAAVREPAAAAARGKMEVPRSERKPGDLKRAAKAALPADTADADDVAVAVAVRAGGAAGGAASAKRAKRNVTKRLQEINALYQLIAEARASC